MNSSNTLIHDTIRSSRRISVSPESLFAVWTDQDGRTEWEQPIWLGGRSMQSEHEGGWSTLLERLATYAKS